MSKPTTAPKRRRPPGKALTAAPAAAQPQGLPALFERAAQSPNFDVEALTKLVALKRDIEADAARRAFDQDFAALQAEIVPVETNAYDAQKRRSYADVNALVDAVAGLVAAKGFALSYDTEPSPVAGSVKITVRLMRDGVERRASVDVPMDGQGMRGNANMSAPQGYGSTVTYGRKLALTLLFNLTVGKRAEETQGQDQRQPADNRPPSSSSDDLLPALKRAAERSDRPPSDKQIEFLASLMRKRGEPASAALDDHGALDRHRAGQEIGARKGGQP